jgi:transcriptional regulator GlxA family with amidase domain
MRLARAKELLAGGTATIRETAATCGFCNAGHFVNVFRQSIGVTPGRWRETQAVT